MGDGTLFLAHDGGGRADADLLFQSRGCRQPAAGGEAGVCSTRARVNLRARAEQRFMARLREDWLGAMWSGGSSGAVSKRSHCSTGGRGAKAPPCCFGSLASPVMFHLPTR